MHVLDLELELYFPAAHIVQAVAVVVSKREFDRLQQLRVEPKPSAMAALLEVTRQLKAEGELELELPARELEPDRLPSF